ncbi:MAG TPA: dienelactone hydrolase family protein [Pseudonocardiaceae bacterium]|jgi:dienelactone hydrolase
MASAAKNLFADLSGPGPHQVMRGDLALAGLPGVVYTPRSGRRLPAVAFGHGWLQPPLRYRGLLRHLASWGIVAAAPATQQGPLGSHRLHAGDLGTALDVCLGIRLGDGDIDIDRDKLGVAGHSTGGGAAVLAAAGNDRFKAVAAFAPAETHPSAAEAAARCDAPGLLLAGGADLIAPATGHAEVIAHAWHGPVTLRTLPKASHLGITEGRHWSQLLLDGKGERTTQRTVRTLFTAFFLLHLAGQARYQQLIDGDVKGCTVDYQHGAEPITTR